MQDYRVRLCNVDVLKCELVLTKAPRKNWICMGGKAVSVLQISPEWANTKEIQGCACEHEKAERITNVDDCGGGRVKWAASWLLLVKTLMSHVSRQPCCVIPLISYLVEFAGHLGVLLTEDVAESQGAGSAHCEEACTRHQQLLSCSSCGKAAKRYINTPGKQGEQLSQVTLHERQGTPTDAASPSEWENMQWVK